MVKTYSEPPVRAQLVALDQRGFRTVLVEKTQPGPFGFYIATGVMHGHRGESFGLVVSLLLTCNGVCPSVRHYEHKAGKLWHVKS